MPLETAEKDPREMATNVLTSLTNDIPDWQRRLDDLSGQIDRRQAELAATGGEQPNASSARAPGRTRRGRQYSAMASAEQPPTTYRTRSMIIVYYDSYVQAFFDELVRFVSTSRNLMRKARMAARVAEIKRMAEMEVPDDDNSPGDDDSVSDGLPSLRYMSTRRLEPMSTSRHGRPPDIFETLDKSLEFVQCTCEHGAHQFLRDADCEEEIKKIRARMSEVLVASKREMERVQREEPEPVESFREASKLRARRPISIKRNMQSRELEAKKPLSKLAAAPGKVEPIKVPAIEAVSSLEADTNSDADDIEDLLTKLQYRSTRQMRSADTVAPLAMQLHDCATIEGTTCLESAQQDNKLVGPSLEQQNPTFRAQCRFKAWWLHHNVWIFPSRHYHGENRGCGRIKMLPTSWKLPLGIDKLAKTLKAEEDRRLPILSLEDHERYGDTYGQYAGGLFTIVTRDSRNISSLLSKQFHKYGYGHLRKLCFGPLLGEGIFTEDGPEWRASRRLLSSMLSNPRCSALHTLDSHFRDLQRRLVSHPKSPAIIDLRPLFYDYTLDTATDLFLGNSTNLLRLPTKVQNEGTRFSKAFNEAVRWLATRERFKMFAWFVTTPGLLRSCSTARDSLENMIIEAQCLETGSETAPFTDFLGKATDLSKARDELMNLLFAARDSNASLLCWLIYALAR
ncbi:hypothetical protein Purlil1_13298 [Purpureocillium lilacinum]|uniref:Cytochrome P450 n=1 Tax=Purpureocillium lilacinum TaxID=33203 RepID=A0ABR0BEF0_PURLI|nr:hypothetical protein Purlil1_13298 [Purpureocillium lilacinum]